MSDLAHARRTACIALAGAVALGAPLLAQDPLAADSTSTIVGQIRELEGQRDPKCYATANRLEDFMYGTPLEAAARFAKIDLQKRLIRGLWERASARARATGAAATLTAADLRPFLAEALHAEPRPDGDWAVRTPAGEVLTITARDLRQYGTVAYALRALLAVQQDAATSGLQLVPLAPDAVQELKRTLDLLTLATLERADRASRAAGRSRIDAATLTAAWQAVVPAGLLAGTSAAPAATTPGSAPQAGEFSTIRAVIQQKIDSFATYNNITMAVFLRNLQVYFARHRWPTDEAQSKALKDYFTEAMIQFTGDLLAASERVAKQAGHPLVRVEDVHSALQQYEPHTVNEYEDVVYFPRLPPAERITIEAYDLDAFRDGGLHWFYLQQALADPKYAGHLEPDPFAAELLTEGAAQFGVLALRVAGQVATERGAARLAVDNLDEALHRIQKLLDRNAAAPAVPTPPAAVASSRESAPPAATDTFFVDQTAASGLRFEHRLSDWLSRLIRGYTVVQDGVARLAIPQAFGGSGVAAEDVDGDGNIDVLLLGGAGLKLFLGDGQGHFHDVTAESGLDWRRADGHPGEPRAPIVADFDNDGRPDVLITYAGDKTRLYRNLGNHRFADVTEGSGLGGEDGVTGPATAADFDGDGLLDVFVGYFGDYPHGVLPTLARRNTNGQPDRIFRNLGGMRFADATAGSGVANPGWGQAAGHTDFDRDGREDLIVGNDFGVNAYYRNLGDFKFADVSAALGTDKPSFTMGIALADLNHDGFPDVYISNIVTMNKDEKYVVPDENTPMKLDPKKLATMRVVEANDLFLSASADGRLQRYEHSDAVGPGLSSTGWSWGAVFFDFDNDGDDDLYVGNGMNEYAVYSSVNPYFTDASGQSRDVMIPVADKERNVFFANRDGRLAEESAKSGADVLSNTRAVVAFDADGDGQLDLLMNDFQGPAVFLRNRGSGRGNHWLGIRLVGDPARHVNRDAIGARIEVSAPHLPPQEHEVLSTVGYLASPPKLQHFGLATETRAEVTVRWPNGEIERIGSLHADRVYTIEQGHGARQRRP